MPGQFDCHTPMVLMQRIARYCSSGSDDASRVLLLAVGTRARVLAVGTNAFVLNLRPTNSI